MCQPTHKKSLTPLAANRVQRANTRLVTAIGVQDPASEGPGLRVPVRKFDHVVQGSVVNNCVRIQDENILALARAKSYVISLRESEVHTVLNNVNLRELSPDLPGGSVVGNNNLKIRRVGAGIDRSRARSNHLNVVPAQYDD